MYRRFVVWEAAAVLRHDIRNKLASVRNAAFYLRRRVESEAAALVEKDRRVPTFFELIGAELDAADRVITERLPVIGGEPAMTPIALGDALADALAALSPPPGVAISGPDGDAAVVADRDELAVALFCVLENAVDAVASSGGTVAIAVRAGPARIAIDVVDDGPGLTIEPQRAVERFTTTRSGRLGLGLPIARRLIGRARGSLELGPGDGRGARAVISLPGAEGA